jgi:hypothetical protein
MWESRRLTTLWASTAFHRIAVICRYYQNDQAKEDEIGKACNTHETDVHTTFWKESLKVKDY